MRQDVGALHQLARITIEGVAAKETLALAASVIRRATGATQAMVVYAEDRDLLVCSDPGDGAGADFTQIGLWIVQRQIIELGGPVAFNLIGHRVEDLTSAFSDDDREFLALTVPTSQSPSEMCILRGPWKHKARAGILRFMESAMPALTLILERFLNADRSRRQGEQLHTLANAAQVLTRSADVEAALTDLATAIAASTGFQYIVNIDMYDATSGRFSLRTLSEHRHTSGTLAQIWKASLNPDRPDPWNTEVMSTLQPTFGPDIQNDQLYPEHVRMFFTRSLLRSAARFPLLFQDEFLGTMSFVSFEPRTFPPEEVSFLQGLVSQAATALKALQMHRELQRHTHELKKSADEYIATTNLTGDIIGKVDDQGRWTFLNDAACQFLGKPREELLGTDSRASVHPEDLEASVHAIRKSAATGEPIEEFVNHQVTPMGTRVMEWNACPFFDEEGRYTGIQMTGRDITERKQMEEALRESEEQYRAIFEQAADSIVLIDAETGAMLRFNDRAHQTLGYTRKEFETLNISDFEVVESPEEIAKHIEKIIKKGPDTFETRHRTKSGEIRNIEVRTRAISTRGRDFIQAIFRDITERKRAEEALAAKTKEYIDTVNLTGDIIIRLDKDGRFTFLNDSACQSFGKPREQLLGSEAAAFMPPEDMEQAARAVEGTIESKGLIKGFESHLVAPTGIRVVEWNGYLLFDEEDEYAGIQITGHDITERKQMEEALRESEARYRLLAENTTDLIWTMDLSLKYTYMSPAVTRMRGYSVEEVVGSTVAETMTPASLEVARKTLAEELAMERMEHKDPQRSRKLELEMYCKDGSTIWTEMNMTFLRDPDGRPVGILGTTRDISERKRAEREREGLHAELELRAITDSLTGLYDHAHFYQRLGEEIERCKRYKHGFAVVMMDVDDFKRFNDSRGHQAGDKMLRLVGYCIRAGLRRSDIAFRYGGDEFAAILPHADSSKARAAVDRINERIAESLKHTDDGATARLRLSAGVACFPDDGTTADDLVRIADAALYNAKWVARARDIMGQREDIQSLVSALVSRRAGVETPAGGVIFRPEALHEQQARIVSSVASSIAVALKDAGVPEALEDPDLQVLATVGAAAEIKDRYIRGHPERTSEVAAALAEKMRLSTQRVRDIRIAGLLHDIGKITVSEGILNKPGKLTRREFASIKDHPIVGATLVSQVKGFERLVPIVRHHHERFDGKGYPDGLAGEDIPPEARILSVVDVFDALTHQRSYRKALSKEEAIAELERGAGTQFDPLVLKAFLALVNRGGGRLPAAAQAASENRQSTPARAPARGKR